MRRGDAPFPDQRSYRNIERASAYFGRFARRLQHVYRVGTYFDISLPRVCVELVYIPARAVAGEEIVKNFISADALSDAFFATAESSEYIA